MAKTGGLGDNWYLGGSDLSGDCQSLVIHGGSAAQQDMTDITQSGMARAALGRDGGMAFVVYHDPTVAHPVLSALPTTDVISTYFRGTAIGNPACSQVSKQVGYDPSRGADGSLTLATQALANGSGQEWGVQLTGGKRTDTAATAGSPFDQGVASTAFGGQAYLQVFSFAGTDATVKIQDSTTSGGVYADVTGLTFAQVTGGAPLAQRIASANTQTIREFVKVTTVTTGGFSSLVFAVHLTINQTAGQVF